MILRNLVLSDKNFRQELKNKLVSDRTIKSLTLCNISHRSSISLDFLIGNNDNDSVSVNEEATASTATGIEELIIERCHLDIDGCKAIGQVLSSSSTKLKSFKMIHVTLLLNNENDDDDDDESCITPIIDGINQAGRNGWLESIDFQRIVTTPTPATTMMVGSGNAQTQLRRLFTSSFKNCINLRSLRLSDCNIGCRSTTTDDDDDDDDDDVHELANTIQKLLSQYGKLQSLDLCRNHIDGNGIEILLQSGLSSYHDDHGGSTSSLKRLILSHNPIGDDGAIHLSRFFSSSSSRNNTSYSSTSTDLMTTRKTSNTKIESMSLIDCDIWSPGCYILSKELKHFNTLRELIVDGEWEDHLDTIIESLSSTNVVLQHLSIHSQSYYDDNEEKDDGNSNDYTIIDQQWKQIEYYLALNRAKLRRLSTKQSLSFALWPTVLENMNNNSNNNNNNGITTRKKNSNNNLYADVWYDVIRRRPELVASVSPSST